MPINPSSFDLWHFPLSTIRFACPRPSNFERTQLNFRLQQLVAMFRRSRGPGRVAFGLLNVGTQQQYTATMPPVQQVQTQFQQPSIFDKLKMGFLMGVRLQYAISQ
jgi:hypothetical protein